MQEYVVKVYENRTEWFQNGKRHRLDGPAAEWKDGCKMWFQNGKRHRLDGPAVELKDNDDRAYYINGVECSKAEYDRKVKELTKPKEPSCANKIVEIDGKKYKLVEVYNMDEKLTMDSATEFIQQFIAKTKGKTPEEMAVMVWNFGNQEWTRGDAWGKSGGCEYCDIDCHDKCEKI